MCLTYSFSMSTWLSFYTLPVVSIALFLLCFAELLKYCLLPSGYFWYPVTNPARSIAQLSIQQWAAQLTRRLTQRIGGLPRQIARAEADNLGADRDEQPTTAITSVHKFQPVQHNILHPSIH